MMRGLITGLMAFTLAGVTAAQGPTPAAPAPQPVGGCPLAELTPLLNGFMEEASAAGEAVIGEIAPNVLIATSTIPEAEFYNTESQLLETSNNVSIALVEPVLLSEVEAIYPACEAEDVAVLAEMLTLAGTGLDLLVPISQFALVPPEGEAEGEAEGAPEPEAEAEAPEPAATG